MNIVAVCYTTHGKRLYIMQGEH